MSTATRPTRASVARERMLARVREADDGRLYIEYAVRKVSGEVKMQRRYGIYAECVRCEHRYFRHNAKGAGYCSTACSRMGKGTAKGIPHPQKMTARSARARADRLFSLAVRSRGACERCGKTEMRVLQCAHIISRSYLATRWDWDNAFCLCSGCHFWGHQHPLEWEEFVESRIGAEGFMLLKKRARAFLKPTRWTYDSIVGTMEELVRLQGLVSEDEDVFDLKLLASRLNERAV